VVETELRIIFGCIGIAFLLFIVELVRRRALIEKYSLIWLGVGVCTGLFGLFPAVFMTTARMLHMHHLTLVTLLLIIFLLLFSVHMSMVMTRLSRQVEELSRAIAIKRKDSIDA